MAERDDLVRAVQAAARTGKDLPAAVAALDEHDRRRTAALAASRETDLSATAVRVTLDPLPAFERHTAATDWLGEVEEPGDYHTAMVAEAARWYRGIPDGLTADPEEFNEQALGHAYTAASAYGDHALPARKVFMQYVGYLVRTSASGLPQIDQISDPKDNPAQTPYPTEVFDNFAPEQHAFNTGVESPNRQSQISSDGAPGIQELERQNAGGSGFGSGPEKPDEHSTSMDTADSYAEVPLGPPGQIPTMPPGPAPSAPSTPNPAVGQDMDEGADQRRQGSISVAAYTRPDSEGFRWRIGSDQDVDTWATPYHEKCGSLHWPEEACYHGAAHTASVAVGYVMSAEDFARRARFEAGGAAEGEAAVRKAGSDLGKLASHHNAIAEGFTAGARTEDEIAWLHGYLARVRPVLAKGAVPSDDNPKLSGDAASCPGCGGKPGKNGGLCASCLASGAKSKKKNKKKAQGSRLDFPLAAEAAAGDPLPLRICPQCGSTYCKHWQGRDKPYDLPGEPWGLAGKEGMRKGAPFAGYKDFADCTRKNSDKGDPDAYCGYIKHKVEDKGKSKKGSMIRLSAADLAAANAELERLAASSLPQIQEHTDSHDNPDPGGDQLDPAVAFPLNPAFTAEWETGPGGAVPKGKAAEAARSSMRPSNQAIAMFGRMDAMQGKSPPHKDSYVFGRHGHGIYLRAHNETRGMIDAVMGRDPVSKEKYAEQTGRPDLHAHYLGAYAEQKARGPVAAEYSGDLPSVQGSQRTADMMTKPHATTDDAAPPFNTAQTTPEPRSSNADADAAQGAADGREDAAAGERPTFADNSSMVSPYVKAYADAYMQAAQPGSGLQQDVPGSMGGDSGQAMNAQQAQTQFMVSRASLQRQAGQCWGCEHRQHMMEPCPAEGCRHLHRPGEEGAGPGMHARGIGWVPDLGAPGYSRPPGQPDSPASQRSIEEGGGASYSPAEYIPRPGSRDELLEHINSDAHGVTGGTDAADRFIIELHERFHDGRLADRSRRRHQHDEPGIDPVFGSRKVAHDFTEEQREDAKHSLGPEHKLPVNSAEDLKNAHIRAHQVKGIPEAEVDAYLSRLDKEYGKKAASRLRQVSAAFVTREALAEPDFRKGYRFAARWVPGSGLITQGSPAFEAGLYAAICDRPDAQRAWVATHERMGGKHPELGDRLDAHASFTRKLAIAEPGRFRASGTGCYPVRADDRLGKAGRGEARNGGPRHRTTRTGATSVDLITDGPGTSPDPMGSTPLNGPGTPPPMGGGEDPARAGGAPPYQGAEPTGSGPVAPDDVLGRPQEQPQPGGPFTQTFSGRHPENADLAPAAPNTAAAPGYQNADAYQGDPQRRQAAFRSRVQASLAALRG